MDFLKKHYEKLILALFLLIFVFLLFYLIGLSKSTNTITKKDLKIPTREPNYKRNDFSHKKYQLSYIFTNDCAWNKSAARSDKDNIYSDLTVPYKCARCPYCDKVIPSYYFYGALDNPRHCPLCDKPLERPPVRPVPGTGGGGAGPGIDQDNDGIPNVIEIKLGLDPNNPDDALYDMDGDGFPNVFEYREKTNIKNARFHPPLYKRLQLIEFRETLLPYKLKTVVTNNSEDPEKWDVQINEIQSDGNIKTKFEYLGGSLKMDNTYYKIVKIVPVFEEERHGGTIVKKDKSKVMFESAKGKYKITMQVDQDVYSPKPKAVIDDLGTDKQYHVGVDDHIVMHVRYKAGNRNMLQTAKYKVLKVDRKKKEVIIEIGKNKEYAVTARALMPRIKKKTVEQEQFQGAPGMPGVPGVPGPGLEAPPGGIPGEASSRRRTIRRNF